MKVVLFCGGFGMRLREYSDLPKPLVHVGGRPIVWHLMQYYSHYGHREFILCLGHKSEAFEQYFLTSGARIVSNRVLKTGARQIQIIPDKGVRWSITFVNTGLYTNIGQRLSYVKSYIQNDDIFLANYADGLTDLYLPQLINFFHSKEAVASFICVPPAQTFHIVKTDHDGYVEGLSDVQKSDLWVNGGYFVFKKDIFDYIGAGEELIYEPFQRLIEEQRLAAYKHDGFWACMDTFKEKQQLDELCANQAGPWELWRTPGGSAPQDSRVFAPALLAV